MNRILAALALFTACTFTLAAPASANESDAAKQQQMIKKIEELEKQINELRSLKLKKEALSVKQEQCMKVVGIETYCTCVVEKLPTMVDYRQYVQILLTPAKEFGYDKMNDEQKKDIDQALTAWAKCVDYKGPKGKGLLDGLLNRETLF